MKTLNQYIQIFNTLEGAESVFANTYNKPVRLLTLTKPTGKGDFFVDTTPAHEERLEVAWPNHYKLLQEKFPQVLTADEPTFKKQVKRQITMNTPEEFFKHYSSLYHFEEGSPEFLIDKEDFKKAMTEYVNDISILLDRERHKVAEARGVLEQIILAAEAGESIPTDILDEARKLIDQ